MTTWHADAELLAAYAGGLLDLARTTSVEQHLLGCGQCRAAIAAVADRPLLDRVWADTVDVIDRPPVSAGERGPAPPGPPPPPPPPARPSPPPHPARLPACVRVAPL